MSDVFFLIGRVAIFFATVWAAYRLARLATVLRSQREEALDYQPIPTSVVDNAVRLFGASTITVVHLYRRLRYFSVTGKGDGASGVVGYVSTTSQKIMVAEPLCAPSDMREVIREFAAYSQSLGKDCLLFPIGESAARIARDLGFGLIQVGKEPVFDLEEYDAGEIEPKVKSAIRQAFKKGLTIEEVRGDDIHAYQGLTELQETLNDWLLTRKSQEMHLINEVSPFKASEGKRYFVARSKDRVEAFLSCSPVPARNGYFIHDLIRRSSAMNGISEALIVAALESFKKSGARFASLGVAPLAGLDSPGANAEYPILNRILCRVFEKHQTFMRFKSLYQFKKKFKPSREEASFVAFYPPRFKLSYIFSLTRLFSPRGVVGDLIFKWHRWLEGSQLPRPLLNMLSSEIAILPRTYPFTFREFAKRVPFTLFVVGLNYYTFLNFRTRMFQFSSEDLSEFGYTYSAALSHKWFTFVTSNFLHLNYVELMLTILGVLLICGTLEFIAGTALTAVAFLLAINADVPNGLIVIPAMELLSLFDHLDLRGVTIDLGPALGVVGAFGALLNFLKFRKQILLISGVGAVLFAIIQRNPFDISYLLAIGVGYAVGYFYLNHTMFNRRVIRLQPIGRNRFPPSGAR